MNSTYVHVSVVSDEASITKRAAIALFIALFLMSAAAGYAFAALRTGQGGLYSNFHNVISYVASFFIA